MQKHCILPCQFYIQLMYIKLFLFYNSHIIHLVFNSKIYRSSLKPFIYETGLSFYSFKGLRVLQDVLKTLQYLTFIEVFCCSNARADPGGGTGD